MSKLRKITRRFIDDLSINQVEYGLALRGADTSDLTYKEKRVLLYMTLLSEWREDKDFLRAL